MEMKKPWDYGKLTVKDDCPYLFNGDKLFFWLGDTAWLLFHKLTREEISLYLRNRAEKGFNVIQAVFAHYFPAVNVYGRNAFIEDKISQPDDLGEDSYWKRADMVVAEAEALGMYVALLPHWGGHASTLAKEDMEVYAAFLAERYKNAPNVIWVTGGDTRGNDAAEYWKCMGRILRERCPDQLITFHPFGRTSSIEYFPDEDWMDFHMFQSGHRRYDQRLLNEWDDVGEGAEERYYGEDNWRYVKDVSKLKIKRPILDAEPSYEHIPQGLHFEQEPYWSTEQVRRYGWWSVLAGACGFTYGHNSIMQFYEGSGKGAFFVRLHWKDALHAPACDAIVHMKMIMEPILKEHWQNAGSGEYLLGGNCVWQEEQKEERIMAFHGGPNILCYTFTGKPIELDGGKVRAYLKGIVDISHCEVNGWWMNPESGVESYLGLVDVNEDMIRFAVPEGDDTHRDWVLILRAEAVY